MALIAGSTGSLGSSMTGGLCWKTIVFLFSVETFSELAMVTRMFLSESVGFYVSAQVNSTPTSQVVSQFPPQGLEPCSPQTAPLPPPRGAVLLTDLAVSWPPSPFSFHLLATVLPPAEQCDPPLSPRLQDRSDEPEVVQPMGSAGR